MIVNNLKQFLSNAYPHKNCRFIFKNTYTIGSVFKLPTAVMSNVIYKFQCERCHASYIGSTRQKFKTRLDQHLGISSRTGQHLTTPNFLASRNHATQLNHTFNRTNFTVMASSDQINLPTLETLYIHQPKPITSI